MNLLSAIEKGLRGGDRPDPTTPGGFLAFVAMGINPNAIQTLYCEIDSVAAREVNSITAGRTGIKDHAEKLRLGVSQQIWEMISEKKKRELIKGLSDERMTAERVEVWVAECVNKHRDILF